jgi:hypothetical protein
MPRWKGEVFRLLQAALQPSPGQVQHQLGPARGEQLENVTEVPTGCCRHRCEQLRVGSLTSAFIQEIPAAPISEPGAFAKTPVDLGVLGVAAKRRQSRLHAVVRRR